jgi:hypothetical protein
VCVDCSLHLAEEEEEEVVVVEEERFLSGMICTVHSLVCLSVSLNSVCACVWIVPFTIFEEEVVDEEEEEAEQRFLSGMMHTVRSLVYALSLPIFLSTLCVRAWIVPFTILEEEVVVVEEEQEEEEEERFRG